MGKVINSRSRNQRKPTKVLENSVINEAETILHRSNAESQENNESLKMRSTERKMISEDEQNSAENVSVFRRQDLFELNSIEDSPHSHHRSPESVLFECQSTELPCCKQLSPKIVPRLTKSKLNLDIPEPLSDDNENDSDRTDSIIEKTMSQRDSPEKEITNESAKDNVLEKTISIHKMFKSNSRQSKNLQIGTSNYSQTILNSGCTKSDVILPFYSLITENSRDNVLYDKKALSIITNNVELPEQMYNCSEGLPHGQSTSSCISRPLELPKTFNYFDIPLSTNQEVQSRGCVYDFGNEKYIEPLGLSDLHYNGQTDKYIIPIVQQHKIAKVHNQPKSMRSPMKYVSSKKRGSSVKLYVNNESDKYFLPKTDSPPAKRCRTTIKFNDIKQPQVFLQPVEIHKSLVASPSTRNNENLNENMKNHWDRWPETLVSVELPTVSDSHCKTKTMDAYATINLDSTIDSVLYVKTNKSLMLQVRDFNIPITRILAYCQWLAKKLIIIMKKSYGIIRRIFACCFASTPRSSIDNNTELGHVMSLIRTENERILSVLTEKVTLLSNELVQVRVNSETTLEAVRMEISVLKEMSNNLTHNNEVLMKELRTFVETRENSKLVTSSKNGPIFAPPPPPPPPPPLPQSITPTTPNSSRKRILRTPTRKCSTPLLGGRPSITVEDLLKVTLKKAPQNNKENRRNTVPTPRGPVVSLDMLRSVKLKSARRRTIDCGVRSPRRAHSLKNRTSSCTSLSPIMTGAVSPLGRLLRQTDGYPRRATKRRLTTPAHSENDLTRESPRKFDAARHSMSRSVIA